MWEKRIAHPGLNAYRVIRGQSQFDVNMKAVAQEAIWAERWNKRIEAEKTRVAKARRLEARHLSSIQITEAKNFAIEQTRELEREREQLETILKSSLARQSKLDWERQKDRSQFAIPKPTLGAPEQIPERPSPVHPSFVPQILPPDLKLIDKLIPSRRAKKIAATEERNSEARKAAAERLDTATRSWEESKAATEAKNSSATLAHSQAVAQWEIERESFRTTQERQHQHIDDLRLRYSKKDAEAVLYHAEEVLGQSEYPENFPQERRVAYEPSNGTLVVDFELPDLAALPKNKDVKYVAARSQFHETPNSDAWLRKTYDDVLYQIALRTLHELFEADAVNALVSIVFNGWVRSIDKATGAETHACVMSLEARKDEFLAINLEHVEPKACFKKLKGVSASKLAELSPVKPLVTLNKEDSRFVDGYAVVESLDEKTNLAAMDWLDFENLIREVFEKEFSKGGGEVKITQASRDGGVDAIAFDPDPIRGGKIVIQAKRYTNTVGVSAVRDLFGTVHNEGANKGILVTTSDFGPDAYGFAKDKPLTLISGAELLYLLSQHGHNAKIDLAEAKKLALEA